MKVDLGRRTTELTKTSLFKSPQDRSFIRSGKILNYIIYPRKRWPLSFSCLTLYYQNISSDYDLICQYRKTYQMMRKHKFVEMVVKMVVKMVVQSTQKKGKRDKIAILTLSSLRWIGEKSLIRMGSDRDLYMSIDNCKRFLFVSFWANLVIKHFQIVMKYDRFLQR